MLACTDSPTTVLDVILILGIFVLMFGVFALMIWKD